MRKFLVVLLILLAALVVGADIGGRALAQNMIAGQVQQQFQMEQEPTVEIGGWAFLPQAIGGTYQEIVISAPSATFGEYPVEQIEVRASDVDAPPAELLSDPQVTAGRIDGSAVLPYSILNPFLPEGITVSTEGGKPYASGELAVTDLGISVPVSAALDITVQDGVVSATPGDIQVEGAPIDISGMVSNMMTVSFPVPQMPFGMTVTDAEAVSGGLRVDGTAENVPLMGAEAV
ncbi:MULTISPECIES: LmeA family phospholipid-binding protein [unclassified Nocardiopsis]|uniref:LmeA family phospholipid-binding protein n=1 Tax=Nocardiopsis TaxID=2013 RepID=UPI00387B1864